MEIEDLNNPTTYQLADIIFDLTEMTASDILVDVNLESKRSIQLQESELKTEFNIPLNTQWKNLLKTTIQTKRISDTDTLCLAVNTIRWNYKNKEVLTPIFISPLNYKIQKVKQEVHLSAEKEYYFLNPFLQNYLKKEFDLTWEKTQEFDADQNTNSFLEFLKENEFEFDFIPNLIVGNFHHHRFQIIKDLEQLSEMKLNSLVDEILGNSIQNKHAKKPLTTQQLVAADKDQLLVFDEINQGNTVIQGPPGTGKSQILTNILGKLLDQGKMNLVVSEKKAALEVLVKKLKIHELDFLTFVATDQTKPRDFIQSLKNSWSKVENLSLKETPNLLLSDQYIDQLQLTLDKLNSDKLIGDVRLDTFHSIRNFRDLDEITYYSSAPTIQEWLNQKPVVESLYEKIKSFEAFKSLNKVAFCEIERLDQQLASWKETVQNLNSDFKIQTWREAEELVKQAALCQLVENELAKSYFQLFKSVSKRKQFYKLRLLYLAQKNNLDLLESETSNWKQTPSESLLESWENLIAGNWWKKRKANLEIKTHLKNANIPTDIALTHWRKYLSAQQELKSTINLFIQIGIERPEVELESIVYLFSQLEKEDENDLKKAFDLPLEQRRNLIKNGEKIQALSRDFRHTFNLTENDILRSILDQMELNCEVLIQSKIDIQNLSLDVYQILQKSNSISEAEMLVLKANWLKFEANFPSLANFKGSEIKNLVEKIQTAQAEERLLFVDSILHKIQNQFQAHHHLLRTPSAKLSADEKELKKTLKRGKAILVKEFSKSKQHQTIRELLSGEARIWIELLQPIWLSTPTQVAIHFPMEKELFSHVIFDEASQIPLAHALGSLQRASFAVVAGDEQQMSPSFYFSSSSKGVDLLHQATYQYRKSQLKHHYRSEHPALIAFSNRHFYDNQLIVYPSFQHAEKPIEIHFVEKGIFVDRQNIEEAKQVATQIEKSLLSSNSIGIVAFSEQQLNCIWKQLSVSAKEKLTEKMENSTAFFRTLEQVQGDECDDLMISLGYGKNENGDFHFRFGPLNQQTGSKRLNVLLTRAKKSIHFFTSVQASDFKLNSNEAVNLLRLFLMKNEQESNAKEIHFPFDLKPTVNGNQLTFTSIATQLPDAKEIVTMHEVLQNRGWEVLYA
ncbi:MAG: AAA domain-containing protein [Crocinitomicaceae bacterium]|nr:AAA domain-containing protein [Crocinitomicaceae bacterium]